MLSTNGMYSQHTRVLNSTHMCVDAVCSIARNFGRRSYVKREEKGPFMSTSHNWPESGKAWQELEAGDYYWAQQAMEYWPDRVREKCKTNRSYAIAHGLEDICKTRDGQAEANRKRRKKHESPKS